MKQYLVLKHSDGFFISVSAQFERYEDAINYAKLASIGDPSHTYEVFERRQ